MTSEWISFANLGLPPVRRISQVRQQWWEKSYECPTVESAKLLADHFRNQAAQLGLANRIAKQTVGEPGFATLSVGHRQLLDDRRSTKQGPLEEPPDPWGLQEETAGDQVVRTRTELLSPALWDQGSPERLLWLRGIAAALDALHRSDWVHGDVKPANVCLANAPTGRPSAMLLDFESVSHVAALSPIASKAYWHPMALAKEGALAVGDAVANDRMGFFSIAAVAVFGAEVDTALFGGSAESASEKSRALNQLHRQVPSARGRLVAAFVAALAHDAALVREKSCTDWLNGLITLASSNQEVSVRPIEYGAIAGRIRDRLKDLRGSEPRERFPAIIGAELVGPFVSGVLLAVVPAMLIFLLITAIGVR